jgi:hypothetical protein
MDTATPAPARGRPTVPAAAPPAALDLDARLAAVDALMTVRLELAALAVAVDSAHPETVVDLAHVITGPVQPLPAPAPALYPTEAAATLQRAAQRLTAGGWCRGAIVDAEGARCLYGAVHAEASSGRAERDALAVLMDAIRRHLPGADSIPAANDGLRSADVAVRLLGEAAALADARGL